jgi:AcrR family transcriptional regulator
MNKLNSGCPQQMSLRERKKAKTRATIQQHALRLFQEHGYSATSVEQIADAAEISPSTFFRYFPTKEDVVLNDEFDARFIEAFNAEPADISPIKAMRHSIKIVYANMAPAERISEQERSKLIFTVPELRSAYMSNLTDLLRMISDMVAKRVNRDPNTLAVRTFAGALMGVALSVIFTQTENPDLDTFTLMDEAFSYLEDGLPL